MKSSKLFKTGCGMNAGLNDASLHHNMKGKKDIIQTFNFITTQIRF